MILTIEVPSATVAAAEELAAKRGQSVEEFLADLFAARFADLVERSTAPAARALLAARTKAATDLRDATRPTVARAR